jgi:hypothetical protein
MKGFLIGRWLLRLRGPDLVIDAGSLGNLSAIAARETAGGPVLWLAGDEAIRFGATAEEAATATQRNAILLLRPEASAGAGGFTLREVITLRSLLPNVALTEDKKGHEDEIDIEGFYLDGDMLWLTGSHSSKRKKPKRGDADAARLAGIGTDANRFLVARIPVDGRRPVAAMADSRRPQQTLRAAALPLSAGDGGPGNAIVRALADDAHLGPFVRRLAAEAGEERDPLPGKDNGFDIEGIAVRGDRVYLGLRGPVLRGWAIILKIRPEDDGAGGLRLAAHSAGRQVIKHFVYLGGMGVRDLAFDGDDLLILAGPTMDVDGTQAVWRLARPHELKPDSLTGTTGSDAWDEGRLDRLFDLPTVETGDRAEGLCRFDHAGERAVLVAYDQTSPARHLPDESGKPTPEAVYLDLFRLPPA